MKTTIIDIRPDYQPRFLVITLALEPNWLERLFRVKPRREEWFGSCTVWRRVVDGRRASTDMESWFSAKWSLWHRELAV